MKISEKTWTILFLRISISTSFLSATADRFGWWPKKVSAWGNWETFVTYTESLTINTPNYMPEYFAIMATSLEIIFGILLLTNFKTSLIAKLSSYLLLLFALAMTISKGIKPPIDYAVFCIAAAAHALSILTKPRQSDNL
jgi:thiosulfate dehydrogenase (quinone) large subunit